MKKIFLSTVIFVLLLAASVFAFTQTSAVNENSCPLKETAQISETDYDYSKVVIANGDSCCQPGADCCKGGACCKRRRK